MNKCKFFNKHLWKEKNKNSQNRLTCGKAKELETYFCFKGKHEKVIGQTEKKHAVTIKIEKLYKSMRMGHCVLDG